MTIRTLLYDGDGRPTDDPSVAMRGEVVELDARGRPTRTFDGLAWLADPKAFEGNPGMAATRPRQAATTETAQRRRPAPRRRLALATACLALLAVATGCSGGNSDKSGSAATESTAAPASQSENPALALQQLLIKVVDDVSPSVVQIETGNGLGSGVVYDGKGDVVTNAHVVGNGRRFSITLAGGDRHPGTLVGTFPPNDLAVVHIEDATPPAAHFDSGPLAVGDIVLAIGNPLGLRSSVTNGIVSSLGRTVSEGNGVVLPSVIQTSAPINPGNSGGALVDLQSKVIGIPTLAALDPEFGSTPAPGIGFAIPGGTVKRIADQLIASGKVTQSGRAYLGVQVTSVVGGGVLVAAVQAGGPAARAGIRAGDVIVAVDKTPVANTDELAAVLAKVKPGTTIPVEVVRNRRKLTIDVQVGQLRSGG
jgi:putative serine protease PepD